MSNISNDDPYDAIEEAIDNASYQICPQVDLDDFDLCNQRSQKDCRQVFYREIGKKSRIISEDQNALDLISYSATCGWLYGYYCGEQEALSTTSAEDDEISNQDYEIEKSGRELNNDRGNSTRKTKEAANSESSPDNNFVESEELESTDDGQIYQKPRRAKYLFIGIAIGAVITAIVCIIIDSQMMG